MEKEQPLWMRRLIDERDQLKSRLTLIDAFMAGDKFAKKHSLEQNLLKQQRNFMYHYLDTLQKRIAFYVSE